MLRTVLPFALFFLLGAVQLAAQTKTPAPPTPQRDTTSRLPARRGLVISGETIICPGSITALKVEGKYKSYQWSTGHTTPAIAVFVPGTYTVTVTTEGGCELTGSVTVRYSEDPCL